MSHAGWLLVFAVFAVGVLHTLVPDHWAPITLLARQRGWSKTQTARAAAVAGLGHTLSTLAIALVVWIAGVAFASRLGRAVDLVTSLALIGFGLWVAIGALRELQEEAHGHGHHHADAPDFSPRRGHAHLHRHEPALVHSHWHTHAPDDWHEVDANVALAPPLHSHEHSTSARMAMLLILGSSPMIEGIPAFFAASRYGAGLIAIMSVVFAASTITTYIVLCVGSMSGLARVNLGPVERYGEVWSGLLIAALGGVFYFIR